MAWWDHEDLKAPELKSKKYKQTFSSEYEECILCNGTGKQKDTKCITCYGDGLVLKGYFDQDY